MLQKTKVLMILGDGKLLGQQRANIQVFLTLQNENIDPIFIIGKKDDTREIETHLNRFNFENIKIDFPGLFNKGMKFKDAIKTFHVLVRCNFSILRSIRKTKPEFIHITNEISFRNLYPALLLSRRKIIYRVGDSPRQHHWVFRYTWRYLIIPLTYRFVCVSNYVKNILITAGAKEKDIKVIYSLPSVRIPGNNLDFTEEIKKSYNIVYLGQIAEHKGIDILIEACIELFKSVSSTNLLIAGNLEKNNKLHSHLLESVNEANMNDRILFLGNVEDISTLFSISHLHVCPSIWEEPLSNTIVEAKSYSVPSIIFKSGGLPEIINHKIDGYICDKKTVEELTLGISFFADDFEKSKTAGKEAKLSLERFGITTESFLKKWLVIYEN